MRLSGFTIRPLLALLLIFGCASLLQAQGARFAQPTVIPTGNWPAAIYTADVNGDGYPDLIYIDQGATAAASVTHVLLSNGKGQFNQSAQLATAGQSLAIGNLFGRGHVDIAWASTGTQYGPTGFGLTMAAGNGDGTFSGPFALQLTEPNKTRPFQGGYLAAFHNNGSAFNGASTVLVQDINNNVLIGSVYPYSTLPTGSSFSVPYSGSTTLPSGTGPVSFADLNGDGYPDVVLNNPVNGTVTSLLTLPATFGFGAGLSAPVLALAGSAASVLLQDVNLDGRIDLIAEGANGRLDVFPGNGDGTFSSTSIGGTGTLDGRSGNGGHLIGLSAPGATGPAAIYTATPAGISSLLGQGTASFTLRGIYNAGPGRSTYALADFNGDGVLDLAVDSPEGIAILYGNADGSFQTSQAFATGQPALAAAAGAFTASKHLDVAVATAATQAQLLLGQGDGTFLTAPAPTTTQTGPAGLWSSVQAADLNGDGLLDLVLTADGSNANLPASGSGMAVQLGQGDGTFGPPTAPLVADQFTRPAPSSCSPPFDHFPGLLYGTSVVADITEDGLADIANRDSGAYRVLLGNNGSAAQSYTNYPTLFFAGSDGTNTMSDCNLNAHQLVATGDLNHDGRPDLVYQSNGSLLVYLTDASGTPNPVGDLAVDGSLTTPGQLTAPDLAPNFGGVSTALGFPAAIGSMLVADLDGDGNQDLLVLYANLAEDLAHPGPQASNVRNYLYVWYGSGDGKFLTSAAHPQNPVRVQPSRDFYQMAVGKLDNSGKPLLAMSDGYLLSLGTLGAEQHLLAGQGINAISVADVRGTGRQDLLVANGGLTLANPVANHEVLAPNLEVNGGGITVLLNQATITTPALTAALVANPEPSLAGNNYTLTLTLTPAAGGIMPVGTVQFSVNNVPLGALTVLVPNGNGGATATVTDNSGRLPGTYQLTAAYSGDPNYAPSVTQTVHNVVLPAPVSPLASATTLSSSLNPSAPGQAVIVSASVTLPGTQVVIASGSVVFTIDGAATGPAVALDASGVARINLPTTLAPGTHAITASYSGAALAGSTPAVLPSVSSPFSQVITFPLGTGPAGFTMDISPTVTSVVTGKIVTLMVRIADQGGFNQAVQLSCSNLPTEVKCMFLPGLVPAGGGLVPLQVFASAPYNCGDPSHPYSGAAGLATPRTLIPFLVSTVLLAMASFRRKSLLKGLALSCMLGSLLLSLSGCGNCTDLGTRPGTYTFTVTGTAQGGPTAQTATKNIQLTVTVN